MNAVQAACAIAHRAQPLVIAGALSKPDGSPVTIADFAAQAAACRILAKAFPGEPIVAEESAQALRDAGDQTLDKVTPFVQESLGVNASRGEVADWIDLGAHREGADRYWTLDPIDGTRGYLQNGHYCAALALIENGRVRVAAIGCPTAAPDKPIEAAAAVDSGAMYYAVAGQGAFETVLAWPQAHHPLKVSEHADIASARLCQRRQADQSAPAIVALRKQLGMTGPVLALDSQVKYAALARGDADVYVRPRKYPAHRDKIWDHAAGALLVEEAGGQVSDLAGRPLDYSLGHEFSRNNGILVSNRLLHGAVLGGAAAIGLAAD
jgi:3'(2'), 5'-bisphosphate nucleotidase